MRLGVVQQGFYLQQRIKFYISFYRYIHVILNGYVGKKRPKRGTNFLSTQYRDLKVCQTSFHFAPSLRGDTAQKQR